MHPGNRKICTNEFLFIGVGFGLDETFSSAETFRFMTGRDFGPVQFRVRFSLFRCWLRGQRGNFVTKKSGALFPLLPRHL